MKFRETETVRSPRMAGRFYPGDRKMLEETLDRLLEDSGELPDSGGVEAVMAPHAGYNYSGRIAAPAYRALAGEQFDTLVIIGHDFGMRAGEILGVLPSYDAFETPLGKMEVDTELVRELVRNDPRFMVQDMVHDRDQTIEVHLPFLQRLGVRCRILPMFFGLASVENCQAVVQALQKWGGNRRIKILASTDLSHYPPADLARQLDRKTLDFIRKKDLPGLCLWQQNSRIEHPGLDISICSAGGVGVAMLWAEAAGASEVRILQTGNSGDGEWGDKERVVGYASLAFVKPAAETKEFGLAEQTRKSLLKIVYERILAGCRREEWISPEGLECAGELSRPAAVFVTLHKDGRLRGCIGMTEPLMPLQKAVEHFAGAAAFEDPRFQPVRKEELPQLTLEISVLSPMKTVNSPDEIVPGRHGVMVSCRGRRGLFLPQVWEQLPDKENFMNCLCREKAGLEPEAWKSPECRIQVFTVLAFSGEAADLVP